MQRELVRELARLEKRGGRAVLATIVRTTGSTPRGEGSGMLIYPGGSISGSIGGGSGEAQIKERALLLLEADAPPEIYYLNYDQELAAEEGLACGGKMEVFLQPFHFMGEIE